MACSGDGGGGRCGVVLLVVQRHRRAEEWAHGGDTVAMSAQSRVADAAALPATANALGFPDRPVLPDVFTQAVVVRVDWHGPAPRDGRYQLIALDRRVRPPRPLRAYGGWNVHGGTGSNWAGAYEKLADHYDWLAGTAPVQTGAGWISRAEAIDAPATGTGSVTGIFLVDDRSLPFTDTAGLLVTVFLVDRHGEVRWGRRLDGQLGPG